MKLGAQADGESQCKELLAAFWEHAEKRCELPRKELTNIMKEDEVVPSGGEWRST